MQETMEKTECRMNLYFLGVERKHSEQSGNDYFLAMFRKLEKPEVYAFYVKAKRKELLNELSVLQQFKKYEVILTLTSYNQKPQVDLSGIAGELEE